MAGEIEHHPRILIVDDDLSQGRVEQVGGRRLRDLLTELKEYGHRILEAVSFADGLANVLSDASIAFLLVDWTLGKNTTGSHQQAIDLLSKARARNAKLPIFLMLDRKVSHTIPLKVMELSNEFVWLLEDSPKFIAGRINAATRRYLEELLPPLANAMVKYAGVNEYSWAAPGHQGGVAFGKNPAGKLFLDWFGENLFRSDMGIERTNLGSVLDHTGAFGAGEKYQSYVFGSTRTYSGVNGSSGSNRVVFSACVQEGQVALCDRNCHKSIEQGLVCSGGIPHYIVPTRNRYGVIGPIPPSSLQAESILAGVATNPLVCAVMAKSGASSPPVPVYAVVTNCTYDGLSIDCHKAERLLGDVVDRLHFDEAWWAYARFNQMYKNRFAMRGDAKDHPKDGPTVFATQSTHKLLAALSQATFIHVREGRTAIPHRVFNEAYCLHTTTSPLYAISASNDISAAMMDGGGGKSLTEECIREAVAFRQSLMRAYREITQTCGSTPLTTIPRAGEGGGEEIGGGIGSVTTRSADIAGSGSGRTNATAAAGAGADASATNANSIMSDSTATSNSALPAAVGKKTGSSQSDKKGSNKNGLTPGSWFFHPFNAWEVTDPATGNKVAFDHAKPDLLATEARCWVLDPQASWHGFPAGSLEDGWCLLDPIKVAIVTPGMSPEGIYEKRGIPAPIVTAYLNERGIIVARTMSHMILFLFSIGITKGKWGTLLSALLAFRADYERNEPVSRVLPTLYEGHRDTYRGKGLRDLCDDMFLFNVRQDQQEVLHAAFERLPTPRMTPRAAFQQLMGTRVETLGLDALEGRTSGMCVIPYPPGIPLLMSGEVVSREHVAYLRAMEAFDRTFPGFENEIQGVNTEDLLDEGYKITVLVEEDEDGGKETREAQDIMAGTPSPASASVTSSASTSSLNSGRGQPKRRKR
ncbi:hypothetical protein VYU27_005582 [Nannochloropsis oceanica]